MIPSTEAAQRVAILFGRRLTTHWSDKEVRAFRCLVKMGAFIDQSDIDLMERYYAAQRVKGDKGIHRRDLLTLLNNWTGELDRARAWAKSRCGSFRKIMNGVRVRDNGCPTTDEQFKRLGEVARSEVERLRTLLGRPIQREAVGDSEQTVGCPNPERGG